MRTILRFTVPVFVAAILATSPALAQVPQQTARAAADEGSVAKPAPPSPPAKVVVQDGLPVDLDRVKQEAEKQPSIKLDDERLRFYVLVLANAPKQVTWKDIVGNYDLMNGPTKGGAPMTHAEFMSMVTPRELNELFSGTSWNAFAVFQASVMNAAGQALVKKAVLDLREAHNAHEIQAIRDRIDRELAALAGKDDR